MERCGRAPRRPSYQIRSMCTCLYVAGHCETIFTTMSDVGCLRCDGLRGRLPVQAAAVGCWEKSTNYKLLNIIPVRIMVVFLQQAALRVLAISP